MSKQHCFRNLLYLGIKTIFFFFYQMMQDGANGRDITPQQHKLWRVPVLPKKKKFLHLGLERPSIIGFYIEEDRETNFVPKSYVDNYNNKVTCFGSSPLWPWRDAGNRQIVCYAQNMFSGGIE